MSKFKYNIAAIIVTYKPNEQSLIKLVNLLYPQVSTIYIVDNASAIPEILSQLNVNLTILPSNMGIAYAQNLGLKLAIAEGFSDFILFDQDSLPSDTMVVDLFNSREKALVEGVKVAAVGPVHIDQDTLQGSVFIKTKRYNVEKITPSIARKYGMSFAQCDFLIASGCLISKNSLDTIGYMENELFIDCVDIEWGFRAKSKGYICIVALDAKMYHKVGDAPLKVLGQSLTTHSPLRHYFYYRNFYRLFQRSYIPWIWKAYTITKSSLQAVIFCLFLKPRLQHFKYIVKGILHGLINRSGKYE